MELSNIILTGSSDLTNLGRTIKPKSAIKPTIDEWTAFSCYNSQALNRDGQILEPTAAQKAASMVHGASEYVIEAVIKCRAYQSAMRQNQR